MKTVSWVSCMLLAPSQQNIDYREDPRTQISGLTKYPVGSLRELWTLALPLMLCALSGTLMLFAGRLVLSHYSPEAMTAAASAGAVFAVFQFGSISIAAIAEIFVAQYNGAQHYSFLARPVWQMIWFSCMTIIPFSLIGYFGPTYLLTDETMKEGAGFFSWLMYCGPLFSLNAALASFYIGQGKIALVSFSIILANVLNFVGNIIFVFGALPGLSPMGATGSGIATVIGQLAATAVLFIRFLWPDYRQKFHTHRWQFDYPLFCQCLKLGVPNAIGHMASIAAWALVTNLLTKISFAHITVFAVNQSIWILLTFITDGCQKAISTVCANLIGAGHSYVIEKVFKTGVLFQLCISLILAIPLLIFPTYLVEAFLSQTHVDPQIHLMVLATCKWIWLALFFEGLTWIIAGILTAGGDTRFIMLMNTFNSWVFGLVPFYIAMVYLNASPNVSIYLMALFAFINMMCFYRRFRTPYWRHSQIRLQPATI